MVKLPENWIDYALVNTNNKSLLLYFVNDDKQYFVYHHRLDPAFTVDQIIEQVEQHDFSSLRVQAFNSKKPSLAEWVDPTNQNWHPILVPFENILPLAQYRKLLEERGHQMEESHANT